MFHSNAENGYKYCMNILQEYVNRETDDPDILTIWAVNLDWYAHLLLNLSRFTEALRYMEKAYEMCVKLNGEEHEQSIVLLNDLGSINFTKGNLDDAIIYLTKAAKIGKKKKKLIFLCKKKKVRDKNYLFCISGEKLPEMEDVASIHNNLGNVYIKKGLLDEAKRSCTKGWKLSKKAKNNESLNEAKLCLEEVKKLLSK